MSEGETTPIFSHPMPRVRKVSMDRPWTWLAKGWVDLRRSPSVGLGYGALFTLAGLVLAVLIWRFDQFAVILPLTGGFLLLAPVLAVGLYETSRRLAAGEPVSMALALTAWQRNISQVALMGVVLLLFFIAWMRLAFLLFMLYFAHEPPDPANFVNEVFLSVDSIPFLLIGTAIGAVLAVLAFAISAVSVPMLLDRDINVVLAIATSVEVVRQNPAAMFVWACLIVLFTGAGLASLYIGLIVTLPLIGHATWHAYKDLVEPVTETAAARASDEAGRAGSPDSAQPGTA